MGKEKDFTRGLDFLRKWEYILSHLRVEGQIMALKKGETANKSKKIKKFVGKTKDGTLSSVKRQDATTSTDIPGVIITREGRQAVDKYCKTVLSLPMVTEQILHDFVPELNSRSVEDIRENYSPFGFASTRQRSSKIPSLNTM